ncbi:MAG: hypothetical protein JF615_16055, partial [Asticcacaulis sp.]|nr:hypothetical protein [Asticcacaulis sp.]
DRLYPVPRGPGADTRYPGRDPRRQCPERGAAVRPGAGACQPVRHHLQRRHGGGDGHPGRPCGPGDRHAGLRPDPETGAAVRPARPPASRPRRCGRAASCQLCYRRGLLYRGGGLRRHVLVGKAFGAGDSEGVARMGRVSFVSAGAFMALVVLGILLGSDVVTRFYTHDALLIPEVRAGLLLSCLFFIPDGLQVVAAQALRARKDVLAPTVIHYVSYGLIMLPLGFVFCLTFGWGVPGLVYAVAVASLISGTFQTGRYLWLDKRALAPVTGVG